MKKLFFYIFFILSIVSQVKADEMESPLRLYTGMVFDGEYLEPSYVNLSNGELLGSAPILGLGLGIHFDLDSGNFFRPEIGLGVKAGAGSNSTFGFGAPNYYSIPFDFNIWIPNSDSNIEIGCGLSFFHMGDLVMLPDGSYQQNDASWMAPLFEVKVDFQNGTELGYEFYPANGPAGPIQNLVIAFKIEKLAAQFERIGENQEQETVSETQDKSPADSLNAGAGIMNNKTSGLVSEDLAQVLVFGTGKNNGILRINKSRIINFDNLFSKLKKKNKEKSEFESTAEYNARIGETADEWYILKADDCLSNEYDADSSSVEARPLECFGIYPDGGLTYAGNFYHVGNFTGQNAFGVTIKIKKYTGSLEVLNVFGDDYMDGVFLPMDAERAKETKKYWKFYWLVKPSGKVSLNADLHKDATFEDPSEVSYSNWDIDCNKLMLVLTDRRTGEVLSIQGPSDTEIK